MTQPTPDQLILGVARTVGDGGFSKYNPLLTEKLGSPDEVERYSDELVRVGKLRPAGQGYAPVSEDEWPINRRVKHVPEQRTRPSIPGISDS